MNRIISGKVRLDVQPVDLSVVIDAAMESVRPSADVRELRLRKLLDRRPVPCTATRIARSRWCGTC